MSEQYQSIITLERINQKFNIEILLLHTEYLDNKNYYPQVVLTISGKRFRFYVDDEYGDLSLKSQPLSLCVVLRELETFEMEDDYHSWCRSQLLNPDSEQVRKQYDMLSEIYPEVERIIGKIDSQISDYDFELNAGAAQALRQNRWSQ